MNKQDKRFGIALLLLLVLSGVLAVVGLTVADHIAYVRLENPSTYQG